MKDIRKSTILTILSLLIFPLSSCQTPQGRVKIVFPPDPAEVKPNTDISKRFQTPDQKEQTAAESAVELSQKYARLSEEAANLRQENKNLMLDNQQLTEQLENLKAQLNQSQKELGQANDLLIEMRIELNNWKTNILGFRDEMRDADSAQLEALLKILNILGAETKTESTQNQEKTSDKIQDKKTTQLPEKNVNQISGESI